MFAAEVGLSWYVAILFAGRSRARQVRHNIDYMVFNNPT